jgi:hypothetical protein
VDISRRRFLAGAGSATLAGSVALAGADVAGAAPAAAPTTGMAAGGAFDLATATPQTFRPYVDTVFHLQRPGEPELKVRLTRIRKEQRPGNGTRSFSLLFRGGQLPPEPAQDSYTFRHKKLGTFDLFVVPAGHRRVQAVINHLR